MSITYHGNCHCGRFRFKLTVDEIADAIVCDCTLCAKKGYLWLSPPAGAFEVTRDEGTMTGYQSAALEDKVRVHNTQRRVSFTLSTVVLQLLWHERHWQALGGTASRPGPCEHQDYPGSQPI